MTKVTKEGFTLIELMIVVAIIGLLAALAIPNFLKFQARSKQSEAKANLKSLYTAQKSYYGDKQAYREFADAIGFEPEFNNRYAYFLGPAGGEEFRNVTPQPKPIGAPGTGTECAGTTGISVIQDDEVKWGVPSTPYAIGQVVVSTLQVNLNGIIPQQPNPGVSSPTGACCAQGQCEFTAGAVGNIDNDATLDVWYISSNGSAVGGPPMVCTGGTGSGNAGTVAEGEAGNLCNDVQF
ncbi:MAG: prepilin-type N-terminal cleavage/methylation domain-containing protein [Myxococcales bacterium]